MSAYESLNYMNIDSLLSEEELVIRQSVRDFVDAEVIPTLQQAHRDESFPSHLISRFGELGLLGSTIKGYDCPGLGDVSYGILMQELESADSGIRSFCSVQGALVMWPIATYGSEQQKQKYLSALASYQLAQAKLVKMVQEITKAQLLSLQLGRLKEAGQMSPQQVSLAKLNNCRMALDVARDARDILGGNGIIDEYPVIRHMMNLETVNTYEGTEDIHRLVVGMAVTGIEAIR